MLRKYKKIIKNYFSRSRVIVIVCVVVAVFLSVNLIKEMINRHQIDDKIRQYKTDVSRLEKENAEISQLIDSWTSSQQLEKEARLKFGLRKPGENVVLIVRDDSGGGNIIDSNSEVLGGVVVRNDIIAPNYKKWWLYFVRK
ncbi:MAG: septum formation initiator family protein [Candidatus Buchananbacteria bacterium]|nr:septum formation initiator family protein [Candidatus Buchananbacteria bacterium]